MQKQSLFKSIPDYLPDELFETLAEGQGSFRLERIVSDGHFSKPGFWYEQPTAEWVVLLRGNATLLFEGEGSVDLQPGDWLEIPGGKRHRIESTDLCGKTIWLALHWKQVGEES